MIAEPAAEMARIASFLGIEVAPETLVQIVNRASFANVRANFDRIVGKTAAFWEHGDKTVLNKGTNGCWRELPGADDLEAYQTLMAQSVPPDCQAWLERGRAALP